MRTVRQAPWHHAHVRDGLGRRKRSRRPGLQSPVTWGVLVVRQAARRRAASCTPKSDFKARKRQAAADEKRRKRKAVRERKAARRRHAAAERRAREKARRRAAKGKPRSSRPRGESHEPGTCGDRDCQRYGCKAYWRGVDDCPRLHEGEGE